MGELITYKLSLDTTYPGCEKQVNLIQGEVEARAIDVTLTNGCGRIVLNSMTDIAVVRGIRTDDKITFNSAVVNNSGNVEYIFTQQDCATSGTGYYEIQILRVEDSNDTESVKVLYSAQFKVKVDTTLYNDEQITAVNEYTALTDALAKVLVYQNQLNQAIEDAQHALDDAIEDAQNNVNDVLYIADGKTIQWTKQSDIKAISSIIDSNKVEVVKSVGSNIMLANLCNAQEKQNIVLEPQDSIKIQGHSFVSISSSEPIIVGRWNESGTQESYKEFSGNSTFDIPSGGYIEIGNMISEGNVELSYILLDTEDVETLSDDYIVPDGYSMVITLSTVAPGQTVDVENIELVTYSLINQYYKKIYADMKDVVIEAIQPTLDGMVPATRKVANLPLNADITPEELYYQLFTKFNNTTFAGAILATGYNVIQSYVSNGNTDVRANTAARHTHDNKEFLDGLSDETLNGMVPTTRKIGNVDLQDDITLNEIGSMVSQAFATGGSWYSTLIPWLYEKVEDAPDVAENTEARHTHENKEYLDELSNVIGELSELTTDNSDSLVEAINSFKSYVDEALINLQQSQNETLELATRERTWKKIRTIIIPGVDAIGQTIDGVTYSGNTENGVKGVAFSTDDNGDTLEGKGITAIHIYWQAIGNATSITQGFLEFNNMRVRYMVGIKPTENTTYALEESINGQGYAASSAVSYRTYSHNRMVVGSEIKDVSLYGFEDTSILGEGSQIDFWAYGYWDDENDEEA